LWVRGEVGGGGATPPPSVLTGPERGGPPPPPLTDGIYRLAVPVRSIGIYVYVHMRLGHEPKRVCPDAHSTRTAEAWVKGMDGVRRSQGTTASQTGLKVLCSY